MKRTHNAVSVLLTISLAAIFLTLVGCGKFSDSLSDEDNFHKFKEAWEGRAFVDENARICAAFYAHPQEKHRLKNKCDVWSEDYYYVVKMDGDIPKQTTLEQFRDSEVWKKLESKIKS